MCFNSGPFLFILCRSVFHVDTKSGSVYYRHSLSLRLQLSGKQSMRRPQMSDGYHRAICSFPSGGNIIQNKTPEGVNVGCIGTHSHFGPLTRGQ